jgi:hypothetical protein
MRRDRRACVEATRNAVVGHPSDGATKTNSQSALGVYLSLGFRGILVFGLPPYNPRGERMAAISWNPSSFAFLFSLSIFLGFPYD